MSRMVLGNLRKDIGRESSQPRRGVRMRGRNRKVLPRDAVRRGDTFVDGFAHFERDSAVVDGDQNSVAISLRRDEPCRMHIVAQKPASPGPANTRHGAVAKDKSQLMSEIQQIIRW